MSLTGWPGSPTAEPLVGRDEELLLLDRFVERASKVGTALLLCGEPGVGKSALLDVAAEMSTSAGRGVIRAAGAGAETDLPFAALSQLMMPLPDEFAQLNVTHRRVLEVALGFSNGATPDRLTTSTAVLTLLRRAAPLVLIVDDLPQLDRASREILSFVIRRLHGSRIGFLGASRRQDPDYVWPPGMAQHEVVALDDEAALKLLNTRFPHLAHGVRNRVLSQAQGNPLALVELPAALTRRQREGLAQLPSVLPLGPRLRTAFASRLTQVPAPARALLLVMALSLADLRATGAGGLGPDALDHLAGAERAGLAHTDPATGQVMFCNPLVRAAVIDLSTEEERRQAHRELAALLVDDSAHQALHLSHAAETPDGRVASMLERAAAGILDRGDAVGAVAALLRASELSTSSTERARRLAETAYFGAKATGRLDEARRLLTDALAGDPELKRSLRGAVIAAYILSSGDGDVDTAYRLLFRILASNVDSGQASDRDCEEAIYTLSRVCFFGGRPDLWQPFDEVITRARPRISEECFLLARLLADPVRASAALLEQLDLLVGSSAVEMNPRRAVHLALASQHVDRLGGCRPALWRVIHDARSGGAVGWGVSACELVALDEFLIGNWQSARSLAEEAVELAEAHGSWTFVARHVQALVAAGTGEGACLQQVVSEMTRWAEPRGAVAVRSCAAHARVLDSLGQGDFEAAYTRAIAISPAGELVPYSPYAAWVMMDLVESAIRTGRRREALHHVEAVRCAGVANISPRLALLAGGATAMVAPDGRALALFARALASPDARRWRFDTARVRLCYGERLRRSQATIQARAELRAALEVFEQLGAAPWVARVESELRASGQTKPRIPKDEQERPTPRELEIAELAAAGLTNKQIGERLFVSPRTVGAHLHRLFPKLGISSRAALRDALGSLAGQGTTSGRRAPSDGDDVGGAMARQGTVD